jgi:hypothetical protein
MGRKRKVHGRLYEGPRGKPVRMAVSETKWPPFIGPAPRGKTGKAHPLTTNLKENSPFVYAFVVEQFRRPARQFDPMIQPILEEYRRVAGTRRQRPSAREFTAFVMERAMDGAWKVWGIKPPFTEGDPDNFFRRYVHGHRHALRDYRKVLREPQPWPSHHRGHWLKHFFGCRGEAAREFNLLTADQPQWTVVTLFEEDAPQ